ncbi:hypothetical protein [Marinobacter orientalis]|uniref:Uncharacterized protein n=1 Tax=Marinobacter orientalis TaxID=1928859 RepID=A0A7Y0RF22_9GAMM|nr:hypothetical protein [Marinobacter orientalis]NMT65055.1 hypothetical protein [Marinobacter orientalis]TGX48995.1 hypothetical protein DIT72_13365 [Marinobacter orientalis]
MKNPADIDETIRAGDTASIENTASEKLSVSLICSDACRVDIDLEPGQVLDFSAGSSDAKIVLHNGDPVNLLIIRPESAS